jgi:hypothetical protein
MAIEDDDMRDREIWTKMSMEWYQKASDLNPWTGRLYHHLAILSRPNSMLQLFYYAKSLTVSFPFYPARQSTLTLLQAVVPRKGQEKKKLWGITKDEGDFITACAYLFLASQDHKLLKKEGYDSLPGFYLMEFDAALRAIEGAAEPVSSSEDQEVPHNPNPDANKRDAETHKAEKHEAQTYKAEKCEAGKPSADESNQEEGNDNDVTVVKPSRYAIQPRYVPL